MLIMQKTEYVKFICQYCGKEFERTARSVRRCNKIGQEIKYCSRECANHGRDTRVEKVCPVCGKTFLMQKRLVKENSFKGGHTCSPECAAKRSEEANSPVEIKCAGCGKIFTVTKSYYNKQLKRGQNVRYCSKKCVSLSANTIEVSCNVCGKKFKINKTKLSANGNSCSWKCRKQYLDSLKHNVTCKYCGKEFTVNNYMFEHSLSKEFHCSMDCKRASLHKEKETYLDVAHTLRTSPQYKEWRKKVFSRDNYTCQECGTKSENIHAHHLRMLYDIAKEKEFNIQEILESKEFNDVDNGITLCSNCHHDKHLFVQRDEKGRFMPL